MEDRLEATARRQRNAPESYSLRSEVAIEDFEDGSLALLCDQLRLVQLNPTAREIVKRLNGQCSVRMLAEMVAEAHGQPLEQVLPDVAGLLDHLESLEVVERRERSNEG